MHKHIFKKVGMKIGMHDCYCFYTNEVDSFTLPVTLKHLYLHNAVHIRFASSHLHLAHSLLHESRIKKILQWSLVDIRAVVVSYTRVSPKRFRIWISCLLLVIRCILVSKSFWNGVTLLYYILNCACDVTYFFFAVWKYQLRNCKKILCNLIPSVFLILLPYLQDHGDQVFIFRGAASSWHFELKLPANQGAKS